MPPRTAGSSVAMGSLPSLLLLTLLTTTAHAAAHPDLDCHGTIWDSPGHACLWACNMNFLRSGCQEDRGHNVGYDDPELGDTCKWCEDVQTKEECLNSYHEDPWNSEHGKATLRKCGWNDWAQDWESPCYLAEEQYHCGTGAGVHKPHPPSPPAPPPPKPPIECQGQPMLENLSVRDPPRECNFYDGNGMGCSGAYVRNEGGLVVRCMYTKVTGDCTKNTDVATASELLCQLIKEEDALQAKIFHELEAEEALQATNADLKAQIEAEEHELDETRGRSHVLGLSFSVVLVLLGLGCIVGFCVMRRRGGVSLPTPDTPGTKLSTRAQRANDRIRMLDAEGYVDSEPIGYDAEQGEDRTVVLGGRFETVELGDEERRHSSRHSSSRSKGRSARGHRDEAAPPPRASAPPPEPRPRSPTLSEALSQVAAEKAAQKFHPNA